MKIKKEDLRKALEIVRPGLANKEIIEQSTSFAFIDKYVVTYNDDISMYHPLPGLKLTGAVEADVLYKLLGKVTEEEIDVVLEEDKVICSSGRMKTSFVLQKEIKLPMEILNEKKKWSPLPDYFADALQLTVSICSQDMSRPILTCVNITGDGYFEASDNFRILRYKIDEMPVDDFLLPASSAKELLKIEPIEICLGQGWVHFRSAEETVFSCRILNDKFPDITAHLKVEGEQVELPKSILEVLDRASVFSKRDHFMDEQLVITIESKKIRVESTTQKGDEFEEVMNLKYDGDKILFRINPELLRDILKQTRLCTIGKNKVYFSGENWEYIGALRVS